jgi:hypothetical protein
MTTRRLIGLYTTTVTLAPLDFKADRHEQQVKVAKPPGRTRLMTIGRSSDDLYHKPTESLNHPIVEATEPPHLHATGGYTR